MLIVLFIVAYCGQEWKATIDRLTKKIDIYHERSIIMDELKIIQMACVNRYWSSYGDQSFKNWCSIERLIDGKFTKGFTSEELSKIMTLVNEFREILVIDDQGFCKILLMIVTFCSFVGSIYRHVFESRNSAQNRQKYFKVK